MVYLPQVFQFTPLREGRPAGIFDATRRPYFNSRPSARGDDGLHTLFERLPDFNSRPSARGDIAALVAFRHVEDFNSRPSARGDREFVHGAARVGISIHAPPRGATSQKNAKKGFTRFQFTPLREGRRAPVWYHIIRSNISIHAPPRGATRACWLAADGADISIHAPPRGATEQNRRESGRRSYFNSRPSARGDLIDKYKTIDYTNFNSRPSARGDAFSRRGATYSQFQFTPLREGRPLSRRFLLSEENFNSRPSARGDEREPADDGAGNYFNSRPSARGDGLVG